MSDSHEERVRVIANNFADKTRHIINNLPDDLDPNDVLTMITHAMLTLNIEIYGKEQTANILRDLATAINMEVVATKMMKH